MRPRSISRQVQQYIKRVAAPAVLARSKVAPHYEAIELILGAGHSWVAAHRFLTQELAVQVSEAAMRQYVLRRRRSVEKRRASSKAGSVPTVAVGRQTILSTAKSATAGPVSTRSDKPALRVGDVEIPEGGTSDWSILSAIRRNAEQDFRELGEAAKRRRRERRRLS